MAETKVVLCLPLGGGRAGRPGKHMLGHGRALSAQRLSVTCEWSWGAGEGRKTLWDPTRVKLRSAGSPHPGGHPKLKTQALGPMWVWQIPEGSIWGLEIPPRDGSQALSWRGFCCPVPTRKENLRSPGLQFPGQAGNELGRNTKFSVKARQHSGGEIQCRRAGGGGRLASGPTLLSLLFMAPDSHSLRS